MVIKTGRIYGRNKCIANKQYWIKTSTSISSEAITDRQNNVRKNAHCLADALNVLLQSSSVVEYKPTEGRPP